MPKGRILSLFILRISFNLCLTFLYDFFYKIDRSRLPKQKLNSIMKKKKEWCNWHFYCPNNTKIQSGENSYLNLHSNIISSQLQSLFLGK